MEKIMSHQNTKIKNAKKLTKKKYQQAAGAYLLEGWHLVQEALIQKVEIEQIFMISKYQDEPILKELDIPCYEIGSDVAKFLSDTKTTQGIFAVIKLTRAQMPTVLSGRYLLLDQVQDPGNIGTMIRTADAAGFSGVVLGQGSVDLYQPKLLRSMQGSHFHIPVYQANLLEWLNDFQTQNVPIYGTKLDKLASVYTNVTPSLNFALIMGNEGNGVSVDLLEKTDQNLYIPIKGAAESLNVAVAAGILMYQLSVL